VDLGRGEQCKSSFERARILSTCGKAFKRT